MSADFICQLPLFSFAVAGHWKAFVALFSLWKISFSLYNSVGLFWDGLYQYLGYGLFNHLSFILAQYNSLAATFVSIITEVSKIYFSGVTSTWSNFPHIFPAPCSQHNRAPLGLKLFSINLPIVVPVRRSPSYTCNLNGIASIIIGKDSKIFYASRRQEVFWVFVC